MRQDFELLGFDDSFSGAPLRAYGRQPDQGWDIVGGVQIMGHAIIAADKIPRKFTVLHHLEMD